MVIMTIKGYIASIRVSEKSLHKRNDIVKVEYHAILSVYIMRLEKHLYHHSPRMPSLLI